MVNAIEINGERFEVKVGSEVLPEKWNGLFRKLEVSEWEGANFRIPTGSNGPIQSLAVNVTITGRKIVHKPFGGRWIRCKVEFVGDGEPSTFSGAWMRV